MIPAKPRVDPRWIVNPYLQAIPDRLIDDALSHVVDASTREQLTAVRSTGELFLVVDLLEQRMVAMLASEAKVLERWRRTHKSLVQPDELDPETLARFRQTGLVLEQEQAYRRHAYRSAEIEINRHCNFRCGFCPVATNPKPKGTMAPELFRLVLDRVTEYGMREISLNHYSEPTLDTALLAKIAQARDLGLGVRLHTNASLFDEAKVRALAELGNARLVVNLPTVDAEEFARVTGTKLFDRVLDNLDLLHRYRVPLELSVNAPRDTGDARLQAINDRFAEMFGPSTLWKTDSRAGRVTDANYVTLVKHKEVISGCTVALSQINVSWEGKAFLCCQDYNQEYVLGDLKTQSVKEIAESDAAVQIRRTLFGGEAPRGNFLCATCEWTQPLTQRESPLSVGTTEKTERSERSLGKIIPRLGIVGVNVLQRGA